MLWVLSILLLDFGGSSVQIIIRLQAPNTTTTTRFHCETTCPCNSPSIKLNFFFHFGVASHINLRVVVQSKLVSVHTYPWEVTRTYTYL